VVVEFAMICNTQGEWTSISSKRAIAPQKMLIVGIKNAVKKPSSYGASRDARMKKIHFTRISHVLRFFNMDLIEKPGTLTIESEIFSTTLNYRVSRV